MTYPYSEPMREVWWNIPAIYHSIMYAGAAISVIIATIGVLDMVNTWSKGREEYSYYGTPGLTHGKGRLGLIWLLLKTVAFKECIFPVRLFERSWKRGALLTVIIWGTIILGIGTTIVAIEDYLKLKFFLHGQVYLVFKISLQLAGGLLLAIIAAAMVRRYVLKPKRMHTTADDTITLVLFFLIILQGFVLQGLRMAVLKPPTIDWSPISYGFALLFIYAMGSDIPLITEAHKTLWLVHALTAFTFLAYIPFSKMSHIFASQISSAASARRYRLDTKDIRNPYLQGTPKKVGPESAPR